MAERGTKKRGADRERAEKELQEREERFRSTLDSMMEGCQIIDFDWRYAYVNDAVAKHGRRAKDELLGHTMMEVYPGIVDTEMFTHLRRCMEERVPHRMENEFTYPDGDTAWFELAVQPVPEGIFILSLDITERKLAEEALRESEEWLSTTLGSIGDAVIATDAEGRVRFLNPVAQAMTGWTQEEAAGKPLSKVFKIMSEETGKPIDDPVAKVTREGTVVGLADHTVLLAGDGTRRPIDDSGAPIRDSQGNIIGVVLVFHDISEQKQASGELRRLTARLLEVQEEERRQFAYDVHDGLGQLMTAASMHLESFSHLRDEAGSPASGAEFDKAKSCLQDAVVEMRRVVSELGPLLLEDVGLVEASRRLLTEMAERMDWETEFKGEVNGDRLDSMAETALYRIVQEALANAAKHSGAKRVSITFTRKKETLLLEIRDWGRGFDPGGMPDRRERGRYVGLVGMRERAALIGGEFRVESVPGKGTKVVVTVPVAPAAAPVIGKKKAEVVKMTDTRKGGGPRERGITVLIADDHPMVREGLRSMLDAEGIEVVGEAANGAEAVEAVQQLNPEVVLMDVRMPDMDGLAASEIIKQGSPETSIIVVTSYESKDYLRRAIEAGAAGYLLKGMSRQSLIEGIRLVRGGGSLIDARLLSDLLKEMGVEGSRFQGAEGTLEALTPREQDVLQFLVRGLTNKEIASEMHYSVGTVKNVVQRVIEKLGVSDRTQAAVYAVRAGLNPPR